MSDDVTLRMEYLGTANLLCSVWSAYKHMCQINGTKPDLDRVGQMESFAEDFNAHQFSVKIVQGKDNSFNIFDR